MFRVPTDTVLRRAAATSLLVLATALTACGGDDDPAKASTPDSTPATTTALTPEEIAAAQQKGVSPPFQVFDKKEAARISDGIEDEASIAKLSDKQLPEAAVMKELKFLEAFDKKQGGTPILTIPGETNSVGSYNEENNKILFFRSEKEAGIGTRKWQQLIGTNPGYGRADRRGTRTYLLIVPKGYKAKNLAQHRAFMKSTEKQLAALSS